MEKEELNVKVESIKKSMDTYRKKDMESKRRAESFEPQDESKPCYPDYQTEYYNLLCLLRNANVTFEKIDGERYITLRYKDCEQNRSCYVDKILDIVKEI